MPKKKKNITTHKPAPVIVLLGTQKGSNIGAAARAMANFGISKLRLVKPKCQWPNNKEAYALASGADAILDNASIHDSLYSAIADCHFICATTARPRYIVKPVISPEQAACNIQINMKKNKNSAILFGCESKGLDNEAIKYAHDICMIPVDINFSSLNLAQSVLLLAYEWHISNSNENYPDAMRDQHKVTETGLPKPNAELASVEQLENFFQRLEQNIEKGKFFKEIKRKPVMMRKIRNFVLRANPSEQELGIMFGIIAALKKSASYFD